MNTDKIISRTVSIERRITNDFYKYGEHSEMAESILKQYATGNSRIDLLNLYMANEGKTIQQLCSDISVSSYESALNDEDNQWIKVFENAILALYKVSKIDTRRITGIHDLAKECINPFITYIFNSIKKRNPNAEIISNQAIQQYCEQYYDRIADMVIDTFITCMKAYYHETDISVLGRIAKGNEAFEFYSWFMSDGIGEVYNTYPLLIKKLCLCALQHINNYFEFICRFEKNIDSLSNRFCIPVEKLYITGLFGNLSDYHHGGKAVQRIEISNKEIIYYKPRSMAIDMSWYSFLRNCQRLGLEFDFYEPVILNCGNYGYMEEITYCPARNESDRKIYFYNAGIMCCIVSMLGGTDFHHENIIAHGCSPVLIDIETLLTPRPRSLYGIQTAENDNNVSTRTGRTLMLQHWVGNSPQGAREIGGFTSKLDPHTNIQTDSQGLLYGAQDYISDFITGYSHAYNFFMINKYKIINQRLLHVFDNCQLRYVFRRTSLYASLNRHFFSARFMRDIKYFEGATSRLCAGILLNFRPEDTKKMWPVAIAERNASSIGDIPYFTCQGNSSDLSTTAGICVRDFFEESPFELAIQNLKAMSEANKQLEVFYINEDLQLCREQNKHLVSTPLISYANKFRPRASCFSIDKNQYIDICGQLLTECEKYRLPGSEFEYYAPVRNRKTTRYNIEVLPTSIYSGNLGIILSKFAYAKIVDDMHMQGKIDDKVCRIHDEEYGHGRSSTTLDISFTQGVTGYLQTLMLLCDLSGDMKYLNMANDIALSIPTENIVRSPHFDFFSGISGLLYYCSKLHYRIPNNKLRDKIESISHALLEMQQNNNEDYPGLWTSSNEYHPLTGLAHGHSGIALALVAAWKVLNTPDLLHSAKAGLAYEMRCYDKQANNWYDFRKFNVKIRDTNPQNTYSPRFMHGYCSGSPGVGLSRIICSEILNTHEYDSDIKNVIEYCQHQKIIGNDTLCCGTAGWIDFLIEASHYLKSPSLYTDAVQICESIQPINSATSYILSSFNNSKEISLFKGLCGIAYQMMRLIAPNEIPSIIR